MRLRLRLLPVVILGAVLLLSVKLGGLWSGADDRLVALSVRQSFAETAEDGGVEAEEAGAADHAQGEAGFEFDGETFDPMMLNRAEIELLQSLHARREELDQRERAFELREKTLGAAERALEAKLDELKKLQKRVEKLLTQYDEEQEERMHSLVKIYENMKPKHAARIFEGLEMDILLDVLERMREAKSAPILALLKPERAKLLTVELAERRSLSVSDAE